MIDEPNPHDQTPARFDDFGTGFSSLSHLASMPIDILKIDRSFVVAGVESARDRRIVEATVGLAHGLGLEVVAEGVETGSHLELVRGLGCDAIQGYLWGAPAVAAEWGGLLRGDGPSGDRPPTTP
jgi:EAL domain-containing protein (putative c-di-GMP-specific phosphodiesterase class I)